MSGKIPTAKEYLNSNSLKGHVVMDSVDEKDIEKDLIEFTKIHVKAALESVKKNICLTEFAMEFLQEGAYDAIDNDSIDNSYPQSNII